jgi:hypothetical protein
VHEECGWNEKDREQQRPQVRPDAKEHRQPAEQEQHSTGEDRGACGGHTAALGVRRHGVSVREVVGRRDEEQGAEQQSADQNDDVHGSPPEEDEPDKTAAPTHPFPAHGGGHARRGSE